MVPPDYLLGFGDSCISSLLSFLFPILSPFNYYAGGLVSRWLSPLLVLLWMCPGFIFIPMILNLEKTLSPILSRLQMEGRR